MESQVAATGTTDPTASTPGDAQDGGAESAPPGASALSAPSGPWSLTVRAPGLRVSLCYDRPGGTEPRARVADRPCAGGVVLAFPTVEAVSATFRGGSGTVIPIPTSLRAAKILRAFRAASARVQETLSAGPMESAAGAEGHPSGVAEPWAEGAALKRRTALLLRAAVEGIAVLANHDDEIRSRAGHIDVGAVAIEVVGAPELSVYIERARVPHRGTPAGFSAGMGRPQRSRARLTFDTVHTAHEVLTGAVRAVEALAHGRVTIRGRFPMVQNLFPIMDRLSDLMSGRRQTQTTDRG